MSSSAIDMTKLNAELDFLKRNPHFDQRPPTILEFLGSDYLNIEERVRPGLRKALVKIFGRSIDPKRISKVRRGMVTGAIGIGKQLRPDELVLTPAGWREIGSLKVGDFVMGKDGLPHSVTGVYRQDNVVMYKMTFKDGVTMESGADHLWEVYQSKTRKIPGTRRTERILEKRIMDTEQLYMEELKTGSSYRFRIPLVDPVEFPEENLPIPPWVLGALIANGALTRGCPDVATDDPEIGERLSAELPDMNIVYSDRRFNVNGTGARRQDSNRVMKAIRELGLTVTSREKFIPEMYLRGAASDRLELLRGLMDSDGSAYGNNVSGYSTSSEQLSKDVAELVRSVGGYCTITSHDREDGTAVEYQVRVNMDQVCPFSLPRKVARWKPRTNQKPARSIVDIEQIGFGEGVCISIDSEDKLYVARDYVVTHNTTFASIVIPYMVCWVTCLKDPQDYFNLMPGSRIAFMLMSTKESQAKEVLFGDIKARISPSPWFRNNCQFDKDFKNQLRFPKDIWVLPGNSAETTFEGYNILGGILDEGDSHKVTKEKDYAEGGWDTIHARIDSRYNDPATKDHMGLLLAVGQMKSAQGFMSRKELELLADKSAIVVKMTIWESLGWDKFLNKDGSRDSFYYDTRRKMIIPKLAATLLGGANEYMIEVPNAYRANFDNNPEKALRDLAGIPPAADNPFISLVDRVDECFERWEESHTQNGNILIPVGPDPVDPKLSDFVVATDSLRRVIHVDIAVSADGDALGLAMGHVSKLVEVDGELKPYIVFDFLMRIKAAPGTEIILGDIRKIIYDLKDERGFRISKVTFDGFQSTDSRQQLNKRRIKTDYVSVDRTLVPYYDLREAIYERRIELPPYLTFINRGETVKVNIAKKELLELSERGGKVDHPQKGSKDVADAIAGVTYTLLGDRQYARIARQAPNGYGDSRPSDVTEETFGRAHSPGTLGILAGLDGMTAPIPPSILDMPPASGILSGL